MTPQTGQQVITIVIGSKDNQTMKFGQLIEYSMRNIFLGKSYTKSDREGIPRSFYKKLKIGHVSRSITGML